MFCILNICLGTLIPKKQLKLQFLLGFQVQYRSKKYASDVGRDDSFKAFGKVSFEPVRQVALDDDWSAMRLRAVAKIKSMTRSNALCVSAAGKRKVTATAKKAMKAMKAAAMKAVRKTAMKK